MTINRRTVTDALLAQVEQGVSIDDIAASAIAVLKRSNQIALLSSIISNLSVRATQFDNAKARRITFARETDNVGDVAQRLVTKYAPHHSAGSDVQVRFDELLIGGFTLDDADMRYDYSIRGLVEQLRNHYQLTAQ